MNLCPFCAEEIQDAAIVCKHCGRDLTPRTSLLSSVAHSKGRLVGYLGAAFLAVGVFLPIARMPIVGTVNYFGNGNRDGTILLVVAVLAAVLTMRHRFGWLLPCGVVATGLLIIVWLTFRARITEMETKMSQELTGNPFRGLAEAMPQSVQLEWGWAVMFAGAALLLVGAFIERTRPSWLAIAVTGITLIPLSLYAYLEL